jgi:hypothetical protein
MSSGAFSAPAMVQCDVRISAGNCTKLCRARIDADFWHGGNVPVEFAGFLELPKPERETLAVSDRLVLILQESGEPYRMILDPFTGRFVARQL